MTSQGCETSSFQRRAGEATDGEAAAAGALWPGSLCRQALVPARVACLGAMGSFADLVSPSLCEQAAACRAGVLDLMHALSYDFMSPCLVQLALLCG